jgi:rubrerythrin
LVLGTVTRTQSTSGARHTSYASLRGCAWPPNYADIAWHDEAELGILSAMIASSSRGLLDAPTDVGHTPLGRLADGTAFFAAIGELAYDPDCDRVQCHLCGEWFRHVGGAHLRHAHGSTLADYREAFRLPRTKPTCCRSTSERSRKAALRRIAAGQLTTGSIADPALGEPARARRHLAPWRSLAAKHPDLLSELHPTRNADLDVYAIGASSNRRAWWKCSACGHEWETRIVTRTSGSACPVCARAQTAERSRGRRSTNRRVPASRSLAIKHPALAAELHPTRNGELDPRALGAGSSQTVWWLCATCGHQWQARPSNRSRGGGCPACADQHRQESLDQRRRANSLATSRPELHKELHRTRNPGLDPNTISAGTDQKAWWHCATCGHEWEAAVGSRSRGSGCPACANERRRHRAAGGPGQVGIDGSGGPVVVSSSLPK